MPYTNLDLAKHVVKGANSNGLGYLEYYSGHRVYHPGYDLNVGYGNQDLGTEIKCPADGVVEFISNNRSNGGFGYHMVIRHEQLGVWSHWLHNKNILVSVGQEIKSGHVIATIGNSGTKSAHCHFEVWTEKLYQIQKKWWRRKFGFYPSRKSKAWVAEHYVDPAIFIDLGITGFKLEPVMSGTSSWEVAIKKTTIMVELYKVLNHPEIYLLGLDGMYHHIADENTFHIFFPKFDNQWNIVPSIDKAKIGYPLVGVYQSK